MLVYTHFSTSIIPAMDRRLSLHPDLTYIGSISIIVITECILFFIIILWWMVRIIIIYLVLSYYSYIIIIIIQLTCWMRYVGMK